MEGKCKCPPPGLPAWMGTFADLMSLLMCFFVLLLSFSEMDVMKFKQIAGSMKFAFGVQNKLEVKDIPKGTSIIAQEFRPGRPEPTPIEAIMQQTIDVTQRTLDFQDGKTDRVGGQDSGESNAQKRKSDSDASKDQSQQVLEPSQMERKAIDTLKKEIQDGAVEVENLGQQLVIRIRENGSFPAGSAFLQPMFRPTIEKITNLIKDMPGHVNIAGFTDDEPVDTELYRSNWDLSAQRAVSVALEMEKVKGFDPMRMEVIGKGKTDPLAPNDTPANRAKNRRVEISIVQGEALESNPISSDAPVAPIQEQDAAISAPPQPLSSTPAPSIAAGSETAAPPSTPAPAAAN